MTPGPPTTRVRPDTQVTQRESEFMVQVTTTAQLVTGVQAKFEARRIDG